MTVTLRIILIVASLVSCTWILSCIRRAKVRIEDSVFWICFSGGLVILSIFPQLIDFGARITGIQSAQNFLFLSIIFVLIIKLFRMTFRISQMDSKLQTLAQTIAIMNKIERDRDTSDVS